MHIAFLSPLTRRSFNLMAEFAESFPLPAFHGQFNPQFCAEFRRKRLALGLSYCALGRFLGVHWSTIRKWENGLICQCSLHSRKRIAGFLRGDFDPRLGAYLRPVSAGAMACVRHLVSCYHLLESRPDLRSLLLDEAFQAAREALLKINAELARSASGK